MIYIYIYLPGLSIIICYHDGCSAFGDLALLYDAPRSATVTATSSGKLWKMERHVYQAIKHAHSKQIEVRKSDAIQSIPLLRSLPLVR